ncbi:MAG: OsmC family protein [Candidatus Sumerlaeota bacterium]|nr:OsmC family protein [Candidatus Sumerlaeota bacterium]
MSVEIDIRYEGDLHCSAQHGPSGKTLITDAPVDNGGKGDAFSPTDLVATSLGVCVLTIMGIVAKRNDWDIRGTRCHVVKDMAAAPTRRIGSLTAIITLPKGLVLGAADRAKLENAVNICPVKQSLHPDVAVKIEYVYPE